MSTAGGYSSFGDRISSGQQTTYTCTDEGDRVTANAVKTTYTHAVPHVLTGVTLPNGYTEARTYDRNGQLTDIVSSKSTNTLESWHGVLDPDGRPQRVDQGGTAAATAPSSYYYTYDKSGRLLTYCSAATKADTCPSGSPVTTYTYDKVGNRLPAVTWRPPQLARRPCSMSDPGRTELPVAALGTAFAVSVAIQAPQLVVPLTFGLTVWIAACAFLKL
ncbi:hypothetical protein ACFY20_44930 [Streptomyces sp. NPDC001312]|uniref:hypothetical protein n=1 Tax=Streptomyces sp. NPDC001312 TaxID=3364561 RepID=UPI00369A5A87